MDERHNAIVLYARGAHWVECTCGWLSQVYPTQQDALVEHALHHVRQEKGKT